LLDRVDCDVDVPFLLVDLGERQADRITVKRQPSGDAGRDPQFESGLNQQRRSSTGQQNQPFGPFPRASRPATLRP